MTRSLVRLAAAPLVLGLVWLLALPHTPAAATPSAMGPARPAGSGELLLMLRKLQVLGSVLYVAAHPDDENTAMIAMLGGERKLRAGYLAVTRGDGGQNLIGAEQGDRIGVLRTQELLAARRIDGGEQRFTRAIDFGYSKTPEETFATWGRERVLADVVAVFRSFRPDVVITRFPANGDGGHGHHTASAILAADAFAAAADPKRFPEQVPALGTWQARRLFWNAWRRDGKEVAGALRVDVGTYNPVLGKSYAEIAAESRSQHKSQGFGSAERRGKLPQDLVLVAGEKAAADPFEGIDTTWRRVPGGEAVGAILARAEAAYDPARPAAVLPLLVEAHAALRTLAPGPWVDVKRRELLEAIRSASGLWFEAMATVPVTSPGETLKVAVTLLNRGDASIGLDGLDLPVPGGPVPPPSTLAPNEPWRAEVELQLPPRLPLSQPYWLTVPPSKGFFEAPFGPVPGSPEGEPPLVVKARLSSGGEVMTFSTPVLFRRTDPVKGEEVNPLQVVPRLTVHLPEKVLVFPDHEPRLVTLTVRSETGKGPVDGIARLLVPPGWAVAPERQDVSVPAGGEARATFTLTPPARPGAGTLGAEVAAGGETFSRELVRIDYPHIPIQTLLPQATARVVHVDLARNGSRVGYVMGPGDDVPVVLRQMGYAVELLGERDLADGDLSRYDAIVAGVRAYNTRPELRRAQARLLAFVERGGTLVVQYNTSQDLVTKELGPYPFEVSRDRVTVEEAAVSLALPDHPLLRAPNAISKADFDGWVQERGLYFPGTWDPRYETPLATGDPGEGEKRGGLIFARYGKGAYVYTGYAFFRQLPAGVPGAIRLFANLVSAGKARG